MSSSSSSKKDKQVGFPLVASSPIKKTKAKAKATPIPRKILNRLSPESRTLLRNYIKEWSTNGWTANLVMPAKLWSEIRLEFYVCSACQFAGYHVCRAACWEGESLFD